MLKQLRARVQEPCEPTSLSRTHSELWARALWAISLSHVSFELRDWLTRSLIGSLRRNSVTALSATLFLGGAGRWQSQWLFFSVATVGKSTGYNYVHFRNKKWSGEHYLSFCCAPSPLPSCSWVAPGIASNCGNLPSRSYLTSTPALDNFLHILTPHVQTFDLVFSI